MADEEAQSLATLATLLDMAREVAEKISLAGDPSYVELMASIAASQLCVLRLIAERTRVQPRRSKSRRS